MFKKTHRHVQKNYWVITSCNTINFVSTIAWKTQVEKESKSVGLEKKDGMNRARWRVGVREIAARVNPATPVYRDKPRSKLV